MNFKVLINNYLKHYIIYLLIFILSIIIGLFFIDNIKPKYKKNIGIMIGTNNEDNYIYKLSKLIKTDLFLNEVNNYFNLNYSLEKLNNMIDINIYEKSNYLNITFIFDNKKDLENISNEIITIIKKYSNNFYNIDNIYLVDYMNNIKTINNKNLYKILIFIFSLILSFIISTIVYLKNKLNEYKIPSYKAPIIKKIE